MTFKEIYGECYQCILNAMVEHYELPFFSLANALEEYNETHGDEAVIDLWGWCCWADANDKENVKWISISHDINGKTDKLMLPRTHGYAKEMWGEGYKNYVSWIDQKAASSGS